MPLTLTNLKKEFSIVEDSEGNPFAINHEHYPNVLTDNPNEEYEIYPIRKIGNGNGEVIYDSKLTMRRSELTPKWLQI